MSTYRIPPPAWLQTPAVKRVLAALPEGRFVGGAVRDTLLGLPIGDLDLAVPYPPEETLKKLADAKIRALPTGLVHGTVTALVDKTPVEVTSLRQDIETDGRHARVAFTADWTADANRRDFTLNALYLAADGTVFDPVGGYQDCLAGRIRFVGDPQERIAEDYLRILRFYRFLARFGQGEPDKEARAACRASTAGLARLAKERVQAEILKLLAASHPICAINCMIEDGIWSALFGDIAADSANLARLIDIAPEPDPIRRLAALISSSADATHLAETLRLSNRDRDRLIALRTPGPPILEADSKFQRREIWRLGAELFRDRVLLEAADTARPERAAVAVALTKSWAPPAFPLTGADIVASGIEPGPNVGQLFGSIRDWWVEGDFQADRAACLAQLRDLTI